MKQIVYKIIYVILIIALIVTVALLIKKELNSRENEDLNKQVLAEFNNSVNTVNIQNVKLHGYDVIGKVYIPKINIEYPILNIETSNPEETKTPMRYGIVKYWGGNVNDYGNLSIAGHNNHNATMFGKTKNLNIDDIVELTDLTNRTIQYKIYNIFVTDPNDVNILKTEDENVREVTLITCTNGNKERLILKAREF